MALSTTATQAEFSTAYAAVYKLEVLLRQYADGSATPDQAGAFH